MNTPVLTAVQQKKTLSARKKSKKTTIKNILASPYANYWPLLQEEETTSLSEVLKKHLVKIKQTKINVPWNDLKNISRENRKAFRLNYTKNKSDEEISCKSAIAFGVNETTKMLETNKASSVLISADVNPQFMVKHVLDQAVLKNIPILVVPNLRNILKEKTGISSLAVAFDASNIDSNYWNIDQKIKEIHLNYPVPLNHINFHRNENIGDDKLSLDSPMKNENNEDQPVTPQEVYLYRKSKSQRIFIPELSQHNNTGDSIIKMEVDNSEFLSLDNSKTNDSQKRKAPSTKVKVSYKSLIVKRVTNNKDRDKKKIEKLKGNK